MDHEDLFAEIKRLNDLLAEANRTAAETTERPRHPFGRSLSPSWPSPF